MHISRLSIGLLCAFAVLGCGGGGPMEMLSPSICTSGPWPCLDYIKAAKTSTDSLLGSSVALSADTLVVGAVGESSQARGINMAIGDDNSATLSGAVYVYRWNGTAWRQEAFLKASNSEAGDTFGTSVAIDGDTLAVSAPGEASGATTVNGSQDSNSAPASGAVYVFQRSGTTWTQQAYLKASNAERSDRFGNSLSLFGDSLAVSANQEDSALVGNPADNSAPNAGAVYVFRRTGSSWAQEAYLKAGSPEAYDGFGDSVSLSADTLAVGSASEDSDARGINGSPDNNNAQKSGAVYVFVRTGSSWSQQAYIKASNSAAGFLFGTSVSLAGSLLAVGAPNASGGGTAGLGTGGMYIFERAGSTWRETSAGNANDLVAGEGFGSAISIFPGRVAVGTPAKANGKGSVYIFEGSGTSWNRTITFTGSDPGDLFGSSVALSGKMLAVGAPGEASGATGINQDQADNSTSGAGATYVFRQP